MTLTPEQLDELERFARAEQKAGWPRCAVEFDVTLHLVAVYRAALAWGEADRRLANAGYSIGDYDDAKDKVDAMLDGIRAALRGQS